MNENLEEDNEAEVIQPAGIEPDEPREEPQGEPEPVVHAAHVGRTAPPRASTPPPPARACPHRSSPSARPAVARPVPAA